MEIPGGWGSKAKVSSVAGGGGGVWMFSGTTRCGKILHVESGLLALESGIQLKFHLQRIQNPDGVESESKTVLDSLKRGDMILFSVDTGPVANLR